MPFVSREWEFPVDEETTGGEFLLVELLDDRMSRCAHRLPGRLEDINLVDPRR